MRFLYILIGLFFVALGVIGIFLPVLPTTPFLLIALWAFSKGSRRLEQWLIHHHLLGPLIDDWRRFRVIPRYAKILAWSMMGISFAYLLFFSEVAMIYVAMAGVVMLIGAIYIGAQPSRRRDEDGTERTLEDRQRTVDP